MGKRPLKCIFLDYKLKKIAGGYSDPFCFANVFVGEKNESQKGGGGIIEMHNIYL